MIISEQDLDIILQDSISQQTDSSTKKLNISVNPFSERESVNAGKTSFSEKEDPPELYDTTSVCLKNKHVDITFFDSTNVLNQIGKQTPDNFPFLFIEKNRDLKMKSKLILQTHLKNGKEIPAKILNDDWIIVIVIISVLIYAIINTLPKKITREVKSFFLFRNTGDPSLSDTGELFHWQSTLFNLVSFLNLALFAYLATAYYNIIPDSIPRFLFWLILLLIIISAATLRHIICYFIGKASGESVAFNEYILSIYLFYRYLAFILFFISILLCYTTFLPAESLFYTGFITIIFFYFVRLIKLFLIFIKKNISIFYLILYLCALEFLPVGILIKYFTGLF